ncbi:protein KRI1 homolog [Acanthaster planci]|uniref:Protein KRI1 homolog n=1 Tax=Acanthaster planci TaxID=133434 RepID=A0A8B7ZB28_ACAPL|nr:protein KRI1 homolog [Acanthaster planci]
MSESDDDLEFRINTKFAESYNKWRRKEELQKLKDRYGEDITDELSSSSEEEDEEAEGLTAQIEKDFLKTLSYVKSRDPRIYDKDAKFYHDKESSYEESSNEDAPPKKKKKQGKKAKEEKPVFLKDYERKIITEKGGRYSDEEEDDEENEEQFGRAASPTYVQEQEMIKDSFQKALQSTDESDDDTLLKKRQKTAKEKKSEEEEYIQWMKGQKETVDDEKTAQDTAEMEALKRYWTDPNLEEGEKFLRDFILNKGYKAKDEERDDPATELEEADFSEEERLLDAQDEFERKYNFRFEEPDSEFIKRYPRTMASSVRAKDNKRALKRQDRKERKQQEKKRKQEDLKQLKNLKKQEILDKLEKLRQVTGNATVGFEDIDLEGDFDPEEHDNAMKKVFNEQYDLLPEEDTKPEFEHEDWEEENWDAWDGRDYEKEEYYQDDYKEPHCDDPDFIMDADYDPSLSKQANKERKIALEQELIGSSKKKKKKRMSKFAEVVNAKKPVFNPNEKTYEDYIEEFYKLDYEDMIDDLPCRFKYRKVIPNDFGLTTEEILSAKERELNQWASLKKTCQYRTEEEEEMDRRIFAKKAKNVAKKQRIFLSLLENPSDSEHSGDEAKPKKSKASNSSNKLPSSKTEKWGKKPPKDSTTPALLETSHWGKVKTNSSAVKNSGISIGNNHEGTLKSETNSNGIQDPINHEKSSLTKNKLKKKKQAPKEAEPEPMESKSRGTTEKRNKANRGFSTSIKHQQVVVKTGEGKQEVKRDVEGEETDAKQLPKKKQKWKRSHTEDSPKGPVIDVYTREMSGLSDSSTIKKSNALHVDPTSATKTDDDTNRTEKKKRKGKIGKVQNDSDQRKIELVPHESDVDVKNQVSISTGSSSTAGRTTSKKKKKKLESSDQKLDLNPKLNQSSKATQGSDPKGLHPDPMKLLTGTSPVKKLDFACVKVKFKQQRLSTESARIKQASKKLPTAECKDSPQKVQPASVASPLPKKKRRTKRKVNIHRPSVVSPTSSKSKSNRTRNKNRNRKLARKVQGAQGATRPTVSDARLKAYGINPKKHVFRMKYLRELEAKKHRKQNQDP